MRAGEAYDANKDPAVLKEVERLAAAIRARNRRRVRVLLTLYTLAVGVGYLLFLVWVNS